MDIIRLRTLTRKSTLGFGQYKDLSIQQIINFQKQQYLRWVYYNIDTITFMSEVLEEIHVYTKDRIPKPGINPGLLKELSHDLLLSRYNKYGMESVARGRTHNRKRLKCKLKDKDRMRIKTYFKKSVLANKNRHYS